MVEAEVALAPVGHLIPDRFQDMFDVIPPERERALIGPVELLLLRVRVLLIGEVSCLHEFSDTEAEGEDELDQLGRLHDVLVGNLSRGGEFAWDHLILEDRPSFVERGRALGMVT